MMHRCNLQAQALAATFVATVLLALPARGDTLLSGFENDLTSTAGASWVTGLTNSYTAVGVTQGATALQLTHATTWTQDFLLEEAALASSVATNDKFLLDATVPATGEWRQLFIVMQGPGNSWMQHGPFDLAVGATTPVALDLSATGIKAVAAADQGWWKINLAFQGGDAGAPAQITTTIDNIRFARVPEPTTAALALGGMIGVALARRCRSR